MIIFSEVIYFKPYAKNLTSGKENLIFININKLNELYIGAKFINIII
jgi:hypothetical protein